MRAVRANSPGSGALHGCAALLLAFSTGCHKSKPIPAAALPPTPYRSTPAPTVARTPVTPAPPAPRLPERSDSSERPERPDTPQGRPISSEVGLASWYGPPYAGHKGADGSVFDQNALTAAHRTLPMGTTVRVTNLATNQAITVRITDRGPFVPGRTLDLSLAAAKAIGVYRAGVAQVRVEAFAHPGSDPAGRWCVQIGAFIDPNDAIQLKNDLISRYKTAKVIEFTGPTGHWVRINPAQPDRATAARIAETIHLPDAEPYLIRTD